MVECGGGGPRIWAVVEVRPQRSVGAVSALLVRCFAIIIILHLAHLRYHYLSANTFLQINVIKS